MVTSWPSASNSATIPRPMKRVPPITSARIGMSGCQGSRSVVVFQSEVSNEVLTAHPPQRVLQFHQLDEDVVLGIQPGGCHGALEVERQPLLVTLHPGTLRQI